ncbi:MAG: CAP domain-containing protein, partial [Clostridiales Family XIII bacterium]|nr:CAP domain-containing protein [Clostridiales Family XIII bacterium]
MYLRVSKPSMVGISFVLILSLIFTMLPGGITVAAGDEKTTITLNEKVSYSEAFKVLKLVNDERAKAGKAPLVMDSGLLDTALIRAGEIAVLFGHTRPDGTDWSTVTGMHKNAYIAENLAAGQVDSAAVVTGAHGWVNSPEHYATMTDDKYKSTGIVLIETGGNKWWVQVFSSKTATAASQPKDISSKAVGISTLLSNLNVGIVISPKVIKQGDKVNYSAVIRNREFDVPLPSSQFGFSLSPAGPVIDTAAGEISTADAAGSFTLTATLKGTAVAAKDFQIIEQGYIPPAGSHDVSYEYEGQTPPGAPVPPVTSAFDVGSKVYVMPPAKHRGSTFSGWTAQDLSVSTDGSFKMPNEDVVFKGSFETSVYTVSYYDIDGELIATQPAVHGSDIYTLPVVPSSSALATDVAYDYLNVQGLPCIYHEDNRYLFDGWETDARTRSNSYEEVSWKDDGAFAGLYVNISGDLNLYSRWIDIDAGLDSGSALGLKEADVFEIFYYASPSDLYVLGDKVIYSKPIAVKTVSRSALDTPILPASGTESAREYLNLADDGNSTYDKPIEWHGIDFGYSTNRGDGVNVAPCTPKSQVEASYFPYKKADYTDVYGLNLPEEYVDGITTIGGFLEIHDLLEDHFLEIQYDYVSQPAIDAEDRPSYERRYAKIEARRASATQYSAISIFLRANAPYAMFYDNIPEEIDHDLPVVVGLPDRVELLVDEEQLWGSAPGTQTVSIRLPDNVPAFEGVHSQDYTFAGWSATPTGGAISKPGEMIQFDVSIDNVNAGDRRIYAQWQKRTFSAYYYLQESDSTYFTSRGGLGWMDVAFPSGGGAEGIKAFLGELNDYVILSSAILWEKIILGSNDGGDEVSYDYASFTGVSNPSTIAEFLRTRAFDYVRIILGWVAVKPAGTDLTVASTYINDASGGEG